MDDIAAIASAKTLKDLVCIVITILSRMPKPIYWVAGPITSGSRTCEENRKRLRDTIVRFKIDGVATINYLPIQKQAMKILRLELGDKESSKEEWHKLQEKLRDELYAPIFRSKKFNVLCLMPQSEMSLNVQWMRGFALAKGISVKCIPEELVSK